MPGQFCLNTLFGNSCQSLLLSFDQNRFSRERITGICLPYLDPKYEGGDIETCVDGSCFYTDQISKKNFCLSQGIYALGDFIVGIDTLGQCLIKNQITRVQIKSCLGLTYCALDIGKGNYTCQMLQLSDPKYPSLSYQAKNANQTCQELNKENSIGCLDGLYCINQYTNNKCEVMNSNDPNKIGRNFFNQQCLPQGAQVAIICQQQYCISSGACIPLSDSHPGQENVTQICLQEQSQGQNGASNCYKNGYCLLTDPLTNKASCFKLDFSNPNTIGIQKDTQLCLQMGQPQAIMCAVEKYCLDQTTNTCQLINTKKGMCIDKNGFCVQNGSCFNCELNQCLSQSNKNTCQDLLQPSITYCKDSQG
ncbi:hypothetical protein TTHERM_01901130 (macronuclear) [Tetrahymena thermophila SB210]|uniref:Uncharacterized protein n=1 Tax=Tetrahymena thermophila (strain SB210) TaxID=312017 RepID=Q227A3_TETTS|nr:hypothetical protein TTHERM_01901130 [Tetrahymena thermophila SB210]EAR81369.2 hypothetical protein TTHERM_01901130 [Tetrahymena thermophila SB210]|eukprot:XP_001029032.2 hypothetical protein TTHERM_01901130 [Tetrahymena thermophila SB210]